MADGTQQQQSATDASSVWLISRLNEDLRHHLEAIMLCVNYCEMLGGNANRNIAGQLTKQLHSELQQALNSADRICSLGGEPEINPYAAQGSDSTEEMLRFKLEDKTETIRSYLARVRQCERLGRTRHGRSDPGNPARRAAAPNLPSDRPDEPRT